MSNSKPSGGIGFIGLLTVVFITLKLCHVIDWSWWWVLAPLWAPLCLGLIIFAAIFAFLFIVELWKNK